VPCPKGLFSRRYGYAGQPQEITVREEAPEKLRFFVLNEATERGLKPSGSRSIICSVLEERPDPSNWSEYPNIWGEVEAYVYHCEWFHVYDFIEGVWRELDSCHRRSVFGEEAATGFEAATEKHSGRPT
jgi:AbiJ N-terminal domain 4